MAKHMTWTLQAQILLVAHDSSPPSDDEWQAWLREFERCAPSAQAMLVYSTGGGPTSSQRKELLAVIARLDRVPRVVIVTSSNLMRGLATAVGWFLAAERRPTMFAVDEMAKALEFLKVEPAARPAIKAELARLAASLTFVTKAAV